MPFVYGGPNTTGGMTPKLPDWTSSIVVFFSGNSFFAIESCSLTLPKTNMSPENGPKRPKRKPDRLPLPSIFRGEVMLVSGRVELIFFDRCVAFFHGDMKLGILHMISQIYFTTYYYLVVSNVAFSQF